MWLIIDDQSVEAGKAILGQLSDQIEGLCIDHDLGPDETGYDVIKWAVQNKCLPHRVQIVSMNPVGCKNIADALIAAGYKKHGTEYVQD